MDRVVGVYSMEYLGYSRTYFRYWDGRSWYYTSTTLEGAVKHFLNNNVSRSAYGGGSTEPILVRATEQGIK